ncbi:hypothetical protein GGI08_003238 [Coemansia sp. S2]|nr:hypothetical protein GGI08_003238 [Coemansia sp. S2]
MSGVSTFGFADNSSLTGRGVNHKQLSSLGLESMAGIVMNAQQSEDSVEQLSSRTAASPYPYSKHADNTSHSTPTYERLQAHSSTYDNTTNASASSNIGDQTNIVRSNSQRVDVTIAESASARLATEAEVVAVVKVNGTKDYATQAPVRERTLRGPVGRPNGQPLALEGSRAVHSTNTLLDRRAYSVDRTTHTKGAVESHHEEAMRRSMHRLISATTRFDSVTGGALSLMADIARLYLMRIGEASRARADLANRTEPNLYDVCDASTIDLGLDWSSLHAWVGDWKTDVGTSLPSAICNQTDCQMLDVPASSDKRRSDADDSEYLASPKRRNSWDGRSSDAAIDDESSLPRRMSDGDLLNSPTIGPCNGVAHSSVPEDTDGGDDLEAMLSGLDLSCLLLDDEDMADGIIPPHLPPLVPMVEPAEDERMSGDVTTSSGGEPSAMRAAVLGAEANGTSTAHARDAPMSASINGGESMGSEAGADDGPESGVARLLEIATSSLSALPPLIVKDKPLYGFFRPETKFDESCAPDDSLPDFDVPEEAYVPALESIAQHLALVDKVKPGHPMFLQGDATKRNVLGDFEEQWRQARLSQYQNISDEIADLAIQEMDESPMPMRPQHLDYSEDTLILDPSVIAHKVDDYHVPAVSISNNNDVEGEVEHVEVPCTDITIAEDILDMDMDVDIDLDILNSLPDTRLDGSDFGDPLFDSSLDMPDFSEPTLPNVDEVPEPPAPLEPVDLPISSGLRGTGKAHWAQEWFTPAMGNRLCQLTAEDVTPCDSLFLINPWVNNRNSIDDIARAFVDSEGGGHLHETTPLEGAGPHGYSAPNGSGSALRWMLHHLMQTKGTPAAESLYTGRSSLAGGISGDGVTQYLSRMFSLIRASAEEEAEQVVSGALRLSKDKDKDANTKAVPEQDKLTEQLIAGAEKRVPWSQNKLDIHTIESKIVNREPQKAEIPPQMLPTPSVDTPLASRRPSLPASSPLPPPPSLPPVPVPEQMPPVLDHQPLSVPEHRQQEPQPDIDQQQHPLEKEQDGANNTGGETETLPRIE